MSDIIPTDLETINEEIDNLLTKTPLTTDRGRLMHLLNAKAALEGDNGGGGGGGDSVGGLAGQSLLGVYTVVQVGGSPYGITEPNQIVVDAGDSTITSVYLSLNNVDDIIVSHAHSNNSTEVVLLIAPLDSTGENTTDLRLFTGTFGGKLNSPNPCIPIEGSNSGGFLTLEADVSYKVYMIPKKYQP
ncbi:hypothetical protein Ares1_0111 [Vibrio phage Ares1]|nr:hypothetical protein Ares1_0111 [Vibrio phage Ares1]